MDAAIEQYILLLLADSNLPTGGFIASSGLESYIQHGYLLSSSSSSSSSVGTGSAAAKAAGVLRFIENSLHSYSSTNLVFFTSIHRLVTAEFHHPSGVNQEEEEGGEGKTIKEIIRLDQLLESMTLNHVTRRASTAQGVALLTLYERSFALEGSKGGRLKRLVERIKYKIRIGETPGHLTIGFGIITAALGLSLPASQHLFLFLHARSLLSSAIRLNTIGPYISHRLLLHDVRPLIQNALTTCRGDLIESNHFQRAKQRGRMMIGGMRIEVEEGAANTWPLGEILAARQDVLHSKIFNS